MASNAPLSPALLFQTRGPCQHHHPVQFLVRPCALCRVTHLELICEMIQDSPASPESLPGPSLLAVSSSTWITIISSKPRDLMAVIWSPSAELSDSLGPIMFHGLRASWPCPRLPSEQAALQTREPGFDSVLLFHVVRLKGASGIASL